MKNIWFAAIVTLCGLVTAGHAQVEWKLTHSSMFDLLSMESGKVEIGDSSENVSGNGLALYAGGYNEDANLFMELDVSGFAWLMMTIINSDKKNTSVDKSYFMSRIGGGIAEKIILGVEFDWRLVKADPIFQDHILGVGLFSGTQLVLFEWLHWRPAVAYLWLITDVQRDKNKGNAVKINNHFFMPFSENWGLSLRLEHSNRMFRDPEINSSVFQIFAGLGYYVD